MNVAHTSPLKHISHLSLPSINTVFTPLCLLPHKLNTYRTSYFIHELTLIKQTVLKLKEKTMPQINPIIMKRMVQVISMSKLLHRHDTYTDTILTQPRWLNTMLTYMILTQPQYSHSHNTHRHDTYTDMMLTQTRCLHRHDAYTDTMLTQTRCLHRHDTYTDTILT